MYIPAEVYRHILETMPIPCVDVLILHQGKCLLLLRDNEPAKGQYWFPGGRIHKNEELTAAALRKSKEETNLTCTFDRIVSVEESIFPKKENMEWDVHTVNICCLVHAADINELKIDGLHTAVKWVDQLDNAFHTAVNHPLSLIGYTN